MLSTPLSREKKDQVLIFEMSSPSYPRHHLLGGYREAPILTSQQNSGAKSQTDNVRKWKTTWVVLEQKILV